MKTLISLVGILLAATVAQAQTAPGSEPQPSTGASSPGATSTTSAQPAAPAGPQVQAEIVSIDATSKTITVRENAAAASGAASTDSVTLPVEGKAITRLTVAKAGDRVTLICAEPGSSSTGSSPTDTSSTASTATGSTTTSSSTGMSPGSAGTSAGSSAGSATDSTSSPDSAGSTTPATGSAAASPSSALQANCPSVVEIAKARATITTPQQ